MGYEFVNTINNKPGFVRLCGAAAVSVVKIKEEPGPLPPDVCPLSKENLRPLRMLRQAGEKDSFTEDEHIDENDSLCCGRL